MDEKTCLELVFVDLEILGGDRPHMTTCTNKMFTNQEIISGIIGNEHIMDILTRFINTDLTILKHLYVAVYLYKLWGLLLLK